MLQRFFTLWSKLRRGLHDLTQPIVTVKARSTCLPIYRGHRNVASFSGGYKVHLQLPVAVCQLQHVLQKATHTLSYHCGLVKGKESVAIELDENPFRLTSYSNARPAPVLEPIECRRPVGRKKAVFNSW